MNWYWIVTGGYKVSQTKIPSLLKIKQYATHVGIIYVSWIWRQGRKTRFRVLAEALVHWQPTETVGFLLFPRKSYPRRYMCTVSLSFSWRMNLRVRQTYFNLLNCHIFYCNPAKDVDFCSFISFFRRSTTGLHISGIKPRWSIFGLLLLSSWPHHYCVVSHSKQNTALYCVPCVFSYSGWAAV